MERCAQSNEPPSIKHNAQFNDPPSPKPSAKPRKSKKLDNNALETQLAECKARIIILETKNREYENTIKLMQSNTSLHSINTENFLSCTSNNHIDLQGQLTIKSLHQDLLHRFDLLEQRTQYQMENNRLHTQIQLLEMQRDLENKRLVLNHGYVQQQPPPAYPYAYSNYPGIIPQKMQEMQCQQVQPGTSFIGGIPTPPQMQRDIQSDKVHILQGQPLYAGSLGQNTQVQAVHGPMSARPGVSQEPSGHQVNSISRQYQPIVNKDMDSNKYEPVRSKVTTKKKTAKENQDCMRQTGTSNLDEQQNRHHMTIDCRNTLGKSNNTESHPEIVTDDEPQLMNKEGCHNNQNRHDKVNGNSLMNTQLSRNINQSFLRHGRTKTTRR